MQRIDGLDFIETCPACPEQYDVKRGSKLVGYLRLRHGHFSVRFPDVNGECIYEATPKGDGCFADTTERLQHLCAAADAINKRLGVSVNAPAEPARVPRLTGERLKDAEMPSANLGVLFRRAAQAAQDAEVREAVKRCTTPDFRGRQTDKDMLAIDTLLRAVQSPRLTGSRWRP